MREGEGKNLREDKKDNTLLGGMVTSAIALMTWDGVDRDRANERWGTGQDSSKKGDTTIEDTQTSSKTFVIHPFVRIHVLTRVQEG